MKLKSDAKGSNPDKTIVDLKKRIIPLFDLQFILVLGRNRDGELITYGELVNMVHMYKQDYSALTGLWGGDNPMLKCLDTAICYINQFEKQIESGELDAGDLVIRFAKENEDEAAILIVQIIKSINSINFFSELANGSVSSYGKIRGIHA